jgi:hypothetical protein
MPTKNVSHDEIAECKDMVRDAQEQILAAIESLEFAISKLPNEGYFNAYLLDHLKIMAASGHGFLSHDPNLDDVIAAFDELETGGDTDPAQDDTEA